MNVITKVKTMITFDQLLSVSETTVKSWLSFSPTKGVFGYRIRIWIHIESLWQADLTYIRK